MELALHILAERPSVANPDGRANMDEEIEV